MALLNVPPGQEEAELARLRKLPWVAYAEPNYVVRAAADAAYPNDPAFGDQWYMRRVYAPEAWAVTFGSLTLVVAVLDSGVDRNHPEFYRQFHDPLLPGWDYVNGDNDPNDDYGHGTHVTGLIAAAANNRLGVAGLAPNIKILPLKVLDASGAGDFYNVAKAIRRAADFRAQVINLSLGGLVQFDEQQVLQSAVDYAVARNVLVVAAAGNCAQGGPGCGYPNPMFYPAACNGVFAVAASDHFDNWATYSNYKSYVSLTAPGGLAEDALLSTVPGGYGFKYGTSMATALVSGAAALVWTMQPAALSAGGWYPEGYCRQGGRQPADRPTAHIHRRPQRLLRLRSSQCGPGRAPGVPAHADPRHGDAGIPPGRLGDAADAAVDADQPQQPTGSVAGHRRAGQFMAKQHPHQRECGVRQPRHPHVAGQFDRVRTRPVLRDGAG